MINLIKKKKKWIKGLFIALISVVVLVLAGLAVLPALIIHPMVSGHFADETYPPQDFGVEAKKIRLKTEDGLEIAAWMTDIDSPAATVLLLSGIQNPSVTAFWGYAKMLNDNGYNALLIEMRAHGESQGDQVYLGMKEWIDVKAGTDYLGTIDAAKDLPLIVWGTSMGGATAINAAGKIPEIDGVISCSAYSSFSETFGDIMQSMEVPKWFCAVEEPFINLYLGIKCGFGDLNIQPKNEIKKM